MTTIKSLTQDEVGILLTSAVHAPSMHNTQPWRFEIAGPVVDVLLDEERTLPAADAAGRLTRIGLGAAAFNVRVAAAMLGHESTVALEPDPARPDLVARIFLAERQAPAPGLGRLYGELSRRRTYRGPMLAQVVSPKVLGHLTEAARAETAELHWFDENQRAQLSRILREADELDLHDEDRLHEQARWIGGDRSGDGIPDSALGPLPARPAVFRDLSAGFDSPHRSQAVFEENPVVAVLSTSSEDDNAWLLAGMALQRVLLTATSYDLAASFLNQATEYPALRRQVQQLIGHPHWPQMIIRFGYPAEEGGNTARRPWQDSLNEWR